MAISVFDLFKVGIGPSSSHTVGPMRAARMFTHALTEQGFLLSVQRVRSEMFGSLGATGRGHGTDAAVLLGLSGYEPDTVDVNMVPVILDGIRNSSRVCLNGLHCIALDAKTDLLLHGLKALAFHANGMRFTAYGAASEVLMERTYYSVGGGFVVGESEAIDEANQESVATFAETLPFPFHSADELLRSRGSMAGASRKSCGAMSAIGAAMR